ncbi:MAG: FAD-dependent oxidoreductase [Gemmatimonadota bacterium]|nr:FAD-dependent oxidoreductase [Gemmatimonadota bacterium]
MVADVTILGSGIIALTAALEIADRGAMVRLVGTTHSGNASAAAGGMLAPAVHAGAGTAQDFANASAARYPGFVAALAARTGRPVPINMRGILEVPASEAEAAGLRASLPSGSRWMNAAELSMEEPGVSGPCGAAFHAANGAVEVLPLMDALRSAVASHEGIHVVREDCCEIHVSADGCSVLTDMESRLASDLVVLAAGAWSALIAGSGPAVAAIQPVRGQMIAFEAECVSHVVCGEDGYLIPRSDGLTVAGGTMEHAGYDASTTPDAIQVLHDRAARLCPALALIPVHSSWAGLRPVTPDLLPIIGPDPERPRLIHASGHSRNGILLAPLTAEVVADIVNGQSPRHDLAQFLPGRTVG